MLKFLHKRASGKSGRSRSGDGDGGDFEKRLSKSLEDNLADMEAFFCNDNDFVVRRFEIAVSGGTRAALLYIDGLVNAEIINHSILQPLILETRKLEGLCDRPLKSISALGDGILASCEISLGKSYSEVCHACLSGDTAVLVDGCDEFIGISTKGFERRSVTEPQTEAVVRGSREGFTEALRVNTSLIRRRLKTPNLRMEMLEIGRKTKTAVCLSYLDNVANPELIKEIKRRLDAIDTDAILSSGYIEEYIEDSPASLFQTIYYSEKPDIIAAKLLEGRCALIIDGTPFVLTMPMLLVECFQSPEDYAIRPQFSTFLRLVRILAFVISLTGPAVYIALTSFHQELIPTTLLFTIAASSENIPFNSFVETSIMLITFEILKEAGVRLPKPIGQAVSIVGALVMGQAAIQAGLVGAPVVVVIAFTGIASFLVPGVYDAASLLRWLLLILASAMGGFGIALGLLCMMIHLASLKSFGSIYLYPYSPLDKSGLKDSVVRAPIWKMRTRPDALKPRDSVRQATVRPDYSEGGDDI